MLKFLKNSSDKKNCEEKYWKFQILFIFKWNFQNELFIH